MVNEAYEKLRKEKLDQYTSAGSLQELLRREDTIHLPTIEVVNKITGKHIPVMGFINKHNTSNNPDARSLRFYSIDAQTDEVLGYESVHLFPATPNYVIGRNAIATVTHKQGVASALVATSQFFLNNLANFHNVSPNTIIYIRSFDENGSDLNELAENSDTYLDVLEKKLEERQRWLRLFGDNGLAGFNRAPDDDRYIEKSIVVRPQDPSLTLAQSIVLFRDSRDRLFDRYETAS